ncbi:SAYSvFN domain-containing protein 1 [Blomia tropicalis]|nr:SAYSvFN domain-containing protein 1 [Blomia tropicalis]
MSDHDILGKKLSNKEKMEMFRSGVSQLTTENDVSNVRELLRQRYLKAKAEEELKEETECEVKTTNDEKKDVNTSKMGRQLARVFRFGKSANNNVRQRHNAAQGRPEVDPFDDPNVFFGAVFFAMSLLIFICTNLRKKAPGELSAYSVFNPFCQHIPSTVGDGQPHDNIVLLGQL